MPTRISRRVIRIRVILGMALGTTVALSALTACGSSGISGSASGGTTHADTTALLHRFVECVRTHGVPGFPDASINSHGAVSFSGPIPAIPDVTRNACQALYAQLPPQPVSSPPVPQPLFQKLLSFARCMRSHGVTDWPDPTPDGTFHLDSRLVAAGKRGIRQQLQICFQANPGASGHFSVSAG